MQIQLDWEQHKRASADVTISGVGTVSAITVSSPGTGYTTTNPPVVLIEKPRTPVEEIKTVTYTGDFGIISGVSTTSVGVASTGIVFDLVIPSDSHSEILLSLELQLQ